MFVINGKVTSAVCYASSIEDEAVAQIERMCSSEFTRGSSVRIMPDVHSGKGCTIGTTMTVTDKVVPNIVGVDIGCGMYTAELEERELDFEKLDSAAHFIPSGMNVWEGKKENFDLQTLRCYRELHFSKRLVRSLGTLGGGNHFIEVDKAQDGRLFLVIHSGSRNLGKQVAELYQKLAIELAHGKEEYFNKKDELIARYKAEGRAREIEKALKELHWKNRESAVPDDLAFLYGKYLEDYIHDLKLCQSFAKRNRELIAEILAERAGLHIVSAFHTVHNYIDTDEMILRKGAIAAHKDEIVLIPINMRDGSILAKGKGNPDWNYSAPHGAGRVMSRTKARESLDMDEYRKSMEGIYTSSVSSATIDEAPMAYKAIDEIIDVISESVDIIEVLKPIFNFKAG